MGSVPLNERRSREGNGEKGGVLQLSCSRCSGRGDGAKRCEQEKRRGGGEGGESFSPASSSPYFSPALLIAPHSTISTPGIGYDYKQSASYTGFPRTTLNKLKNSVLVLQIAINTKTYVTTSPLKVSSSNSLSFSLSSIVFSTGWVTFISPVALTELLTTGPVLIKLVFL